MKFTQQLAVLQIDQLDFKNLLFAARNYLGEIAYLDRVDQVMANDISRRRLKENSNETPKELRPFFDDVDPLLPDWVGASTHADEPKPNKTFELAVLPQTKQKALFLDRDGIINVDHGYVGKVEHVQLMPGIGALIAKANRQRYHVNVITNQSGIGRGFYSNNDYQGVMTHIQTLLKDDQASLDHIEYAPYHPEAINPIYRLGRHLRKPRPGMILKLHEKFRYDLSNSILIGDKASDLMAGFVAGVGRLYLFESDHANDEWRIINEWLHALKQYGLQDEFDSIQYRQLTDFSEIVL